MIVTISNNVRSVSNITQPMSYVKWTDNTLMTIAMYSTCCRVSADWETNEQMNQEHFWNSPIKMTIKTASCSCLLLFNMFVCCCFLLLFVVVHCNLLFVCCQSCLSCWSFVADASNWICEWTALACPSKTRWFNSAQQNQEKWKLNMHT